MRTPTLTFLKGSKRGGQPASKPKLRTAYSLCAIQALFFLSGCASVKITEVYEEKTLSPSPSKKEVTTIAPFVTTPAHPNPQLTTKYLDPETGFIYIGKKDNPPKVSKLGEILAQSIKQRVRKANHEGATVTELKPKSGIWVRGQMVDEIQGSRALRALIGLGAGKTKLGTRTFVFNLNKSKTRPWLTLWTQGGSGYEPGALFSAVPSPLPVFNLVGGISTLGTLINHSNKGLTQDAKRTGKVIAKAIIARTGKK